MYENLKGICLEHLLYLVSEENQFYIYVVNVNRLSAAEHQFKQQMVSIIFKNKKLGVCSIYFSF